MVGQLQVERYFRKKGPIADWPSGTDSFRSLVLAGETSECSLFSTSRDLLAQFGKPR